MGVVAGGKLGRMFFWGLLLLEAALVSLVNGQGIVVRSLCQMQDEADISFTHADGVFLRFREETLISDSFVDFDDTLNIGDFPLAPTNRAPARDDAALQCMTDLVDCCGTESGSPLRTVRGDWYFPDGTTVEFGSGAQFLVNRGPNEVINGEHFNGSVRLFRRFSAVPERGRFRCELPNAANPSVNQVLYVNICEFIIQLVVCTNNIMFPVVSTVQ